jgi:TRAP-type C4-dicarboxylate transport system substrate-binding protein
MSSQLPSFIPHDVSGPNDRNHNRNREGDARSFLVPTMPVTPRPRGGSVTMAVAWIAAMERRHRAVRVGLLILLVAAALGAAGCTAGAHGPDKAGGGAEPTVLHLADTSGDLRFQPTVQEFADRVNELSNGSLRIESVDRWGNFADDAETQVVRAVADGDVDLGWVGTRVFDTMGVNSFQALSAPMLVDSYALEEAVIRARITDRMLKGVRRLGVAGVAVLPDVLRKPIAAGRPIVRLADWRGLRFATLPSEVQAAAIRALGAVPAQVFGKGRQQGLDDGTISGFEMGIWLYESSSSATVRRKAPYVTSNVDLWPQMDAVIANPSRLASLTDEQRGWLDEAAKQAATDSAVLIAADTKAVRDSCAGGSRFAEASPADVARIRAAFAPVYEVLERDRRTKAYMQEIRALKHATRGEGPPGVPPGCTGKAPTQPTSGISTAGSKLDGTYRWIISRGDAAKANQVDPEDVYPQVTTIRLKDGRLQGGCFGSQGGTYLVQGNQITFHSFEYGYSMRVRYAVEGGNLHLTPIPPMDPGDAFVCFSKTWVRIG